MRQILAASGLGLALVLTGCSGSADTSSSVEVEDCDAEDFLNKEAECGFVKGKKPTVKPAPKATKKSSSSSKSSSSRRKK